MNTLNAIAKAFKRQATSTLANSERTRTAFTNVLDYLDRSGVFLPPLRHRITNRFFGSHFTDADRGPFLLLSCYPPNDFVTEWFVMHEVGHVLWHFYEPCRNRAFRSVFGVPEPDNYHQIYRNLSWQGPALQLLGRRPHGEPSPYGEQGGGEERFCELIGLMYATGGFDQCPPKDLRIMWETCWHHGLARMTNDKIRKT